MRRSIVVLIALSSPAFGDPEPDAAGPKPPPESTTPAPTSIVAPVPPDVGPKTPPAPRFTWEPYGYLRLQYIIVQNDPFMQFVGRDDGFELQNARVGVRGKLDDRAKFVLAFEGAVDERTQVNSPDSKLRTQIKDAYTDVALPAQLSVRAGYFLTLVEPNLAGDTARELADKPLESRGMRATEGLQTPGLTPGRSLGAALRLEPAEPTTGPAVGFELAIQNGADEYAANNDNDKPAVSASALVKLPHDGWLVMSGRFNPRSVGAVQARQEENDFQGTAGARFVAGPVALEAAVVAVRTTYPTTGGPHADAYGGHGQAAFRIDMPNPIAIVYRFGILDPSSLITTDRVIEHTAGVVMAVPAYRLRVQLQATHVVDQRALDNDRVQLAAEVSL